MTRVLCGEYFGFEWSGGGGMMSCEAISPTALLIFVSGIGGGGGWGGRLVMLFYICRHSNV